MSRSYSGEDVAPVGSREVGPHLSGPGEQKSTPKDKISGFTLVPETMSTPCFAWLRACTIVRRVDLASPSS